MSAPKAPDPAKTAAAQAQSNKETAIAQFGLNATNQVTPWGNLTYTQIGKWEDGTPRYQASTTLSPEQLKLYQQQTTLGGKLNDLAIGQTDRLSGVLSQPVDLSNEATESRLMELGRKRLDPLMAQRKSATEADLINRGIRPGTEAYNRAMTAVGQQENDAYNELLLKGRGQSVQETLAERNQPINEISALLSGGQVTSPQFVNTPTPGVNGTDVAGITNNAYQQEMAGYQSKMSGLLGLGTALGGWMFSDERLKTDKHKVGETGDGLGVYSYRYKGSPMMQVGVMAQEVERKKPEAVRKVGGYRQVNYDMIGGV